jgi:hypothetical protein
MVQVRVPRFGRPMTVMLVALILCACAAAGMARVTATAATLTLTRLFVKVSPLLVSLG